MIYFVGEKYDYSGNEISVHEGKKMKGKKEGLMRLADQESVALGWFAADARRGNQIYKRRDEAECRKESTYTDENGEVYPGEFAGDMVFN